MNACSLFKSLVNCNTWKSILWTNDLKGIGEYSAKKSIFFPDWRKNYEISPNFSLSDVENCPKLHFLSRSAFLGEKLSKFALFGVKIAPTHIPPPYLYLAEYSPMSVNQWDCSIFVALNLCTLLYDLSVIPKPLFCQ